MNQEPKKFTFIYSKAIVKQSGRRHNLQLTVNAIAYFYSFGDVRTVDIESMEYNDVRLPDNLLWAIDDELDAEINEAALEHAQDKFAQIFTNEEL